MYRTSAAAASCPASAGPLPDATWERADLEYQVQRYARALELYEQIAAGGDARAAELAGHMLVFGETLYGSAVPRDTARAARWLVQAAQAGRPIALHLLREISPTASGAMQKGPLPRSCRSSRKSIPTTQERAMTKATPFTPRPSMILAALATAVAGLFLVDYTLSPASAAKPTAMARAFPTPDITGGDSRADDYRLERDSCCTAAH